MKTWFLQNKQPNLLFEKIPVTYDKPMQLQALAYYTAKHSGKAQTFSEILYDAIHSQEIIIAEPVALKAFLEKVGVSLQDIDYGFSSITLQSQLRENQALVLKHKIYSIPQIIVAGRYRLRHENMMDDPKRFIATLNALVQLAKSHEQT